MPSIRSLLQPLFDHPAFKAACRYAELPRHTDGESFSLSGLTPPAKSTVAAALACELDRAVIFIAADNETAAPLCRTASTVFHWLEPASHQIVTSLPAFDFSPYDLQSPHPGILERRAVTLWQVAHGRASLLFVPLTAALMRFRDVAFYRALSLEIHTGDELAPEDLVEHLIKVGYVQTEPVSAVGQFSVRGGIADLFSPESLSPCRVEFFGDSIESLREFDPVTQRSKQSRPSILVLPLAETARSPAFFDRLVEVLTRRNPGAQGRPLRPNWADSYAGPFPGWEFYLPLVESYPNSLASLFERPVIVWDQMPERVTQLKCLSETLQSGFETVRDMVPQPPRPDDLFLSEEEFWKSFEGAPFISLNELEIETDPVPGRSLGPCGRQVYTLNTQPVPRFPGSLKVMSETLRQGLESGKKILLVVSAAPRVARLREILTDYHIPFENLLSSKQGDATDSREQIPPGDRTGGPGAVLVAPGDVEAGVAFTDFDLLLLTERDVLGDFVWGGQRRREGAAAAFLSGLGDLKVGDYVVHVDHGVGIYRGLKQLGVGGLTRDFMLLTYQDDAKLYVPLERLDLVEKYRSGEEGRKPKVDQLGGASWHRTKKRVQRALRDMAQELLRLYAERAIRGGTAFAPDNNWQREFEDSFPFEETPDQVTALAEIKQDMESPKPMDRLLCGDVGYGKTELAMRAAFKAVQEDKQVAVLAPTTVLAFQHFTTFLQRMSRFPIRIEMLSRFRSSAAIKQTMADVLAGKVDITIGTHRLLSKDVQFHDLGLLIVDEEQRFGVAAKERLKRLRADVDVLTMSATPIPRTLQMALGGLRDLSVIESPPRGRLAIQTTVATFNDGLIQSAILHEMERKGQVYFIHNRVESIFNIAARLQRTAPTARIGVAHGQMGERELERTMQKFMAAQYDVLVATALVENGLDISRANTMIVNHAERFGLADLYQLRGRIGRSDRRAYAYFLVPAVDTLTPIAKRRLAALKEFSDLGAGFRLAALDLELRGAGNVLGREQHGHLNAVGVDLYFRMLEEAVQGLKGEPSKPEVHTTLNLGIDIKIPEDYIRDERQRLRMYKRISALTTHEGRTDMESELSDRYGPLPAPVNRLLDYAILKSRAERLFVQTIDRKGNEIRVRFHPDAPIAPERLRHLIEERQGLAFQPDYVLRIRIPDHGADLVAETENILMELQA